MTVTTSSRNPAVANMAERDGQEEAKAYVREHYGIPIDIDDWPTIDSMAERIQEDRNKKWMETK